MIASLEGMHPWRGGISGGSLLPSPIPPPAGPIVATYTSLLAPSQLLFSRVALTWIPLSPVPLYWLVPSPGSVHDSF